MVGDEIMTETRVLRYCPQCKHGWLMEKNKVEWQGDKRSLSNFEKELGRKLGVCTCGLDLYSLEYKSSNKVKNGKNKKRKTASRD